MMGEVLMNMGERQRTLRSKNFGEKDKKTKKERVLMEQNVAALIYGEGTMASCNGKSYNGVPTM